MRLPLTPLMKIRPTLLCIMAAVSTVAIGSVCASPTAEPAVGNVIFIHPDGTGLGHWHAGRLLNAGPDGDLHWDRLDRMASYRPHQQGWLSTNSHAGGTVHAYGVKALHDSYGLRAGEAITAANGRQETIMETAMREGLRVGIVNTGHIGEPGTGVFLARSGRRSDVNGIAEQILTSGADLIFTGGEIHLLPTGTAGFHGEAGTRTDGRNLIEEAKAAGYRIVYDRAGLHALPENTSKVVGIFAARDTFYTLSEEDLEAAGLETYDPQAPAFDELVQVALRILYNDPERRFFLMAEEEGTDNFSNVQNANGMLEALTRADRAIGEALAFMATQESSATLLLVGADSDAGHPTIWAPRRFPLDRALPARTKTGALLDGRDGSESLPFVTPPDQFGERHAFGIAWPIDDDMPGSAVTKASGFGSEWLPVNADNTDLYRLIHRVLISPLP